MVLSQRKILGKGVSPALPTPLEVFLLEILMAVGAWPERHAYLSEDVVVEDEIGA